MKRLFGSVDLLHCLSRLGFTPLRQKSTSHVKFMPPKNHVVPKGVRPFMIVQLNRKQYDKHSCSRYVSEIALMGFNRKEVLQCLED